jgi:hypothetical protein
MTNALRRAAVPFGLAAALSLAAGAACAAVATVPTALDVSAWTDLGAGPLQLSASGAPLWWVIADACPSGAAPAGWEMFPLGDPRPIDTASHVCALAAASGATAIVAPIATNPAQASTVGDGVVTGGLATVSIDVGGTLYVAGDVGKTVALVGGTSTTAAQVTISAVSGGAVTGVTIANPGVYSAAPSQPTATTGGGTAGSGLSLWIGTAPIAQTLFGGTAPVNGWKIANPNASGDIWASDNGTAPAVNGASSYRCAATGGSCKTEPGEKPPGSAVQLLGASIGAPFIARRW